MLTYIDVYSLVFVSSLQGLRHAIEAKRSCLLNWKSILSNDLEFRTLFYALICKFRQQLI